MSHSKYCGKILAIGDDSCGKTCLFTAFVRKQFPSLYIPTVFQGWASEITVDGSNVLLALVDTVSDEAYDHVRPLMFQDATIFLVCYSVDNLDSLQNVRSKYVQEMRQFCPGVPFILVGLKIDLRYDDAVKNELQTRKTNQSPVSFKQGEAAAEAIGAHRYLECSAGSGEGVERVFECAANASLAPKPDKPSKCTIL
ncbi:ras-like GTP-binding protein Rho1-like protein [Rhizoclosmatium globosum]|uniref:Ras-like GTP-binding protein Rho1-like protein n=1 Tax=Rhizoclosmatium globosum TaxID=329046 RepID=A0A1Y2CWX1_9FUNG|nr:ras-like GTP-binding protein Rho1-like protein [Rhizoclosmatium globosum]|eukprot:ORY51386.1 ras-like GTP-binding protein Rho1-like protein [Rhizoclosmatium globosum]